MRRILRYSSIVTLVSLCCTAILIIHTYTSNSIQYKQILMTTAPDIFISAVVPDTALYTKRLANNQQRLVHNPQRLIHQQQQLVHHPQRLVHQIDCIKLIEGNDVETKKANSLPYSKFNRKIDKYFLNVTKNCTNFKYIRGYEAFPISTEEKKFPIAFSILLYKDVEQAERLLRAIYRPSNIYCFHVDSSAQKVVHNAIQAISNCFDNVFVVSKKENVVYTGFSRLQADINCMKDLITKNNSWKYFINLPSQQFPLRTNSELVKILKIYNGANDIEGITIQRRMMSKRYRNKTAPPHGVHMVKGSAYGVFSRKMVNFILTNKKAKDILEWSKIIKSPDEYYWAILNHNKKLGAPGGYWGDPNKKPWLATYASWGAHGGGNCHGKYVRSVCIFGVGDLPALVSRKELFANKFYLDYQPYVLDCLEEWLFNKTVNNMPFETYYYKHLPFINKT